MTGWWRWLYYNIGWEYPNDPTEETKRQRHELMVQIKSYNDNIQTILLREEGEIRERTPVTEVGILENNSNKIKPIKTRKRKKRRRSNNIHF
jgi:hypothetical protein